MKVYEGHKPSMPQPNSKTNKAGGKESDFQKIMDQMNTRVEKRPESVVSKDVGPVSDGIHIIQDPGRVDSASHILKQQAVIKELQQALDLVDFYSVKLADDSFPIAKIDPLMDHLEDRLKTLRGMEQDPGLPGKLKPILSDMVITIGTEIAKFKRGDYQ